MIIDISKLKLEKNELENRIEERINDYMDNDKHLETAIRAVVNEVRGHDFSTGYFESETLPDLIYEIYTNAYMAGRQDVLKKITDAII